MKPKHPERVYDINDKPPKEAHDGDAFLDTCLDLYDVIKYGTRRERKLAARELVLLAVTMEEAFVKADNELRAVRSMPPDEPPPPEAKERMPTADVTAAPSDLSTAGTEAGALCGLRPYTPTEHPGR